MNTSDTNGDADENALAYAAISLCGNTPRGPSPQWHEVAAWRAGTLPESRATEVLSHVANDPDCFQQWLDIAEAEAWTQEEALATNSMLGATPIAETVASEPHAVSPPQSNRTQQIKPGPSLVQKAIDTLRSLFQQPLPVYGGAFAAVMLAVLVAPLLRTGDGLSLQQQLDRSMDTYIESGQGYVGTPPPPRNTRTLGALFDNLTTSDVERLHFQSGMRLFNQQVQQSPASQASVNQTWQDWLAALPDEAIDCSKAADPVHCTEVADDFTQLGQWSLMNTAACQALSAQAQGQASPAQDYWTEQFVLYEQMRKLPAVSQSQVFAPLLPDLPEQSPDTLCSVVASIIATGQ